MLCENSMSVQKIFIIPTFIKENKNKKNCFICECNTCKDLKEETVLKSIVEIKEHIKKFNINFFKCPECDFNLPTHSTTITKHIKKFHQKVVDKLKLYNEGKMALYCKECDDYSDVIHHHCFECKNIGKEKMFTSKKGIDDHLKNDHMKYWLEINCRNGVKCNGFLNGTCSFNHNKHAEKYIIQNSVDTTIICKFEKPWDNCRCKKIECSFDHLWNRVKAVNIMKKKKKKSLLIDSDSESESESESELGSDSESGSDESDNQKIKKSCSTSCFHIL